MELDHADMYTNLRKKILKDANDMERQIARLRLDLMEMATEFAGDT